MHLTQQELNALAEEADHTHHEGMKHFREEMSEIHLDSARSTKSRLAMPAVVGDKAAKGPNEKLVAALTPTLTGLKDEAGALEFAFTLENQAAYTYAAALTLLQDPAYAAATSTILPIEAQHAVVLGLALGKPVTDVFPTMAFESSALGDGTDPKAGIDPAIYG